ncbi:uncharacterized protein DS421_16g566410 [Arachis hypogaea]|nr:uncharacterized protein DS421_16g566410 [Arachis hypogaea]
MAEPMKAQAEPKLLIFKFGEKITLEKEAQAEPKKKRGNSGRTTEVQNRGRGTQIKGEERGKEQKCREASRNLQRRRQPLASPTK